MQLLCSFGFLFVGRFVAFCIVDGSTGTIHRPVLLYLMAVSTVRPQYLISTPIPNLVNDTSHPASQNFTTEISEYDASPGIIWHSLAAAGSSGRLRSPVCVECTWSPLGSVAAIGFVATFLFMTGAPVTRK